MAQFMNIQNNVFSIFASAEWVAESIKTLPNNFVNINPDDEFIRVSIIPSGYSSNINAKTGVLNIEIYTKVGTGPKRPSTIADKLDSYLSGKQIIVSPGITAQFFGSSMMPNGKDKDNPTLYKYTYTIPFNYFEVM